MCPTPNASAYSGRSDSLTTYVMHAQTKLLLAVYIWLRLCIYAGSHIVCPYRDLNGWVTSADIIFVEIFVTIIHHFLVQMFRCKWKDALPNFYSPLPLLKWEDVKLW